jgi:glutamate synthase domain-containing protein 3
METYDQYQLVAGTQACALRGEKPIGSDSITLWTGGVAGLRFGFYGTKGLAFYSGGTMVYYIEDLSITNIVVDGNPCVTPSEAIVLIYFLIS